MSPNTPSKSIFFFCRCGALALTTALLLSANQANCASAANEAQPAANQQGTKNRELSFPEKSVGGVYLCPVEVEQLDFNAFRASKRFCMAAGKVKVPMKASDTIMLELNPDALQHPEVLTKVSEAGIGRLRISYVSMEDNAPSVTDKVFAVIPHFQHLISVDAFQSDLTDKGLAYLGTIKSLKLVALAMTSVKGQQLGILTKLPNLRILNLNFCTLDPGVLANLRGSSLQHLHLHGAKITDEDLAGLVNLKNLKMLDVGQTRISDEAVNYFLQMPALETLNIAETNMSMTAMKNLSKANLKWLTLPRVHYSDSEMELLHKYFPHTTLYNSARKLKKDEKQMFSPLPN